MKTNGCDCAFGFGTGRWAPGLTKREYFATQALIGLLAKGYKYPTKNEAGIFSGYGADAITIADDLIKELNKNNE